jgi:hypothetical protein
MAPTLNASLCNAIVGEISKPSYKPRPLALLEESVWPESFEVSESEGGKASLPALDREFYHQVGTATLNQAIFLMVLDDLRGKPVGYSQVRMSESPAGTTM